VRVRRPSLAARFRARSHAWFAQARRRLALARLHGQMADLTQRERDALRGSDFPPRALTAEEREQDAHLDNLGAEAVDRRRRLAPQGAELPLYDFIFGSSDGDA